MLIHILKDVVSKFKSPDGLATYSDYARNTAMGVVDDKSDQQKRFMNINIIYGYNSSGKTSLSRLVCSRETGATLSGVSYEIEPGEAPKKQYHPVQNQALVTSAG